MPCDGDLEYENWTDQYQLQLDLNKFFLYLFNQQIWNADADVRWTAGCLSAIDLATDLARS